MRVDIPQKVAGKTVFGFDFKLPDMLVATVSRPPAYGAKPESFDKEAAMAIKGVVAVAPVEDKVGRSALKTPGPPCRARKPLISNGPGQPSRSE
jgi:isoquinoline 1-oxidoreductase beta subunit